jgi:glutathione reductase (NADPH)
LAEKTGMNVHKSSNVKKVEKNSSGSMTVHIDSLDKPLENVDVLLWAIGRHANTEHLSPEVIKLEMDKKGDIVADKYQETNVPDVYALGDVAGKVLLTPVAIAAGRRLSNRLFGGLR